MQAEKEPLLGASSVALASPAAADPAERPADFALILTDVSTYRSSKAKSFLRSLWLLGPAPARDEQALLQLLAETLGRAGFRVVRPPPGLLAADSPDSVTLLLTGTDARLQREHYREQARTRAARAPGTAHPPRASPPAGNPRTNARAFDTAARRVDPLALAGVVSRCLLCTNIYLTTASRKRYTYRRAHAYAMPEPSSPTRAELESARAGSMGSEFRLDCRSLPRRPMSEVTAA